MPTLHDVNKIRSAEVRELERREDREMFRKMVLLLAMLAAAVTGLIVLARLIT